MSDHPTQGYLDAVSDLMRDTTTFLNDLRLYPRRGFSAENILPALLSKSIVLAQAVVCLVANGFEDEAYGLCRTSVEIQVIIRFICNRETDGRTKRYAEYFAKDNRRWGELLAKYYPNLERKESTDEAEMNAMAAQYKTHTKWHEKTLKEIAAEEDTFATRGDGSPLTDDFYYEVIYKWMSHYVHGTIVGIQGHLTEFGDPFVVHNGAARKSHGPAAIRTAFLNVSLNLTRVLRYLALEFPDSLKDKFDSVINKYV